MYGSAPRHLAFLVFILAVVPAPAAASDCAFIAAAGFDAIVVSDLGNDRITGYLPVGTGPVDVAVSTDGRRAWAVNTEGHSVSVLDLWTGRAIATVAVGFFPARVALHPDGSRVYVSDRRSFRLSVIDAETSASLGTIPTQGDGPAGIAITRDGNRAFVANSFADRVVEIDLQQGQALGSVSVGEIPFALALTPDDSRVYVANSESGTVSVVRTADRSVIDTLAVGGNPYDVAVHPDGAHVYVANGPIGSVSVIDATSHTRLDPIVIGPANATELSGIAFSPDGDRAYVVEFIFGNLFTIDTASRAILGFASIGGIHTAPQALTVARIAGRCPRSPDPLLTAGADASDVEISLERPDLLPVAGTLRIDDELVTYDGRRLREAVLNVGRAEGGTAAAAHAAGTPAKLVGGYGDANCDAIVSAGDLAALSRQAPNGWRPCGGDMNRDGVISEADALLLVYEVFAAG